MSIKRDFLKSLVSPLLDEVGRSAGKELSKLFFGDKEKGKEKDKKKEEEDKTP